MLRRKGSLMMFWIVIVVRRTRTLTPSTQPQLVTPSNPVGESELVDAVMNEARKIPSDKSFYIGNINYFHKPLRHGKWAVTYQV